jgi:O-antigen/teichoic acid export membrane protein
MYPQIEVLLFLKQSGRMIDRLRTQMAVNGREMLDGLRSSLWVFAGAMTINVTGYLYHFMLARLIRPADYSLLVALLALAGPLTSSLGPLRMLFAERIASAPAAQHPHLIRLTLRQSAQWAVGVAGLLALILLAGGRLIQAFLDIPDLSQLLLIALLLEANLAYGAISGIVQGLERFVALGVSSMLLGLVQLGVGVGLTLAGFGVLGALSGVPAGLLGAALVCAIPVMAAARQPAAPSPALPKAVLPYFSYLLINRLVLSLLINVDVIMARRLFDANTAGLYAALSVLGKIALYLPGAVTVVLFPKIVHQLGGEGRPLRVMLPSLALSLGTSALVPLAFALAPGLLVSLLFGAQYVGLEPVVWQYGLAMLPLVVTRVLVPYFLASRSVAFTLLVGAATAAEVGLMTLFPNGLSSFTLIVGGVNLALAACLVALAFSQQAGAGPVAPAGSGEMPGDRPL